MKMSSDSTKCPICSVISQLGCGACKKVSYCSKEHQKNHWKIHKIDCFPAQIETNDQVGRHLVATRDIRQGEIIFREKPLVSGPVRKVDCFPVCLGCFKKVQSNYICSKCKWPVCDSTCEKNPDHSNFECEIFQNRCSPPSKSSETSIYDKIIFLRGVLMKRKNPQTWDKIQTLQSHEESRKDHNSRVLSQTTTGFIRGTCGLKDIEISDIDHILGAVSTNAFVSDDAVSSGHLYRSGSYLFFYGSMPAHDCTSNSSWIIQNKNSEFVLRASVAIPAGSSITQLYAQPTLGTRDRRLHLKQTKYFDCECARCSDPKELGTNFSSVKCTACDSGYLLPVKKSDNVNTNVDGEWKCDNTQCQKIESDSFVQKVINDIEHDPRLLTLTEEDSIKSIGVLEKILKSHQGKTVHPNHYCMHTLENDLLQRMSFLLSSPSIVQNESERILLAEKMTVVAKKCLEISDIIWPGFNRHRGRLLYFLQQSLMVPLQKFLTSFQQQSLKSGRTKKQPMKGGQVEKFKTTFQDVLELRKQVYVILCIEPEGREESFIANMMMQETDDIRELKKIFKL